MPKPKKKSSKKRFEYLYELDKAQRRKNIEQKKKYDKLKEEKEINECTFAPRISSSRWGKTLTTSSNATIDQGVPQSSMLTRQEYWTTRRNEKLEKVKKEVIDKMLDECNFSPQIRSDSEIKWNIFNGKTETLVADPESYELYLQRVRGKREKDEKKRLEELNKPGSGNVWKNKYLLPESVSKKTFNTIEQTHKKSLSFFNQKHISPIEESEVKYEDAVRCLHDELLSIKLMN